MQKGQKIDVVVVLPSDGRLEIILDQIEAIRWSCEQKIEIVVVDIKGCFKELPHASIIHNKNLISCLEINRQTFCTNFAIKKILDDGIEFNSVIVLQDDALPIKKEIDTWALSEIKESKNVGLFGLLDLEKSNLYFWRKQKILEVTIQMYEWRNLGNRLPPAHFILPSFEIYTKNFVDKMLKDGFLSENMMRWKYEGGIFQTWVTHIIGFEVFLHHPMTPPFFYRKSNHMDWHFQHKINEKVKIFGSTKDNKFATETETRAFFAQQRNSNKK